MNAYNVFARLREPSTWAGFAAIAALFGHTVAPEIVTTVAASIGAIGAIFLPENK